MPIMAANERNDARTRAWLLATTAKEFITRSKADPDGAVALNNVYRLLEAYKTNPFFGLEPPRRQYGQRGRADVPLQARVDQGVSDLRIAVKRAMELAFHGESEADVIANLEAALRTASEAPEELSENDRNRPLIFLDALVKNL